jgi:hypothetical protein
MRIYPLIACVLALSLTGCVPWVRSIYKPSAEGGKLLETMCRYNSGPGIWNKIQFSRLDVEINFQVWRVKDMKDAISIELDIPEGKTVKFASSSATIVSPSLHEPLKLIATTFYWFEAPKTRGEHYETMRRPIGTPIIGDGNGRKKRSIYVKFEANESLPDSFELTSPEILINETSINLPKIKFDWGKTVYLPSINC